MSRALVFILMLGALVVAGLLLVPATPVSAHFVPAPCDFITSGGFVFKDDGSRANFGAHGGCKHGAFWGHVNYVDHGGVMPLWFVFPIPLHFGSNPDTRYLGVPGHPNTRRDFRVPRTHS